ncbi:putative 2-dehydropantoate 2-reductase [soil metagenome]
MSKFSPSIAIIGAGAVGGYYGARLAQHGHDVHFLVRSDYDVIRENGWHIKSIDGDFTIPPDRVHVYKSPADMPKVDLAVVATKTTSNAALPGLLRPILHDRSYVLTLQNGLGCEEDLAALFGDDRILGGMAFVCINRLSAGVVDHMDHGIIRLGPFSESARGMAKQVVDLFKQSKIRCEELADLKYGRWLKLAWNIPFNGFGTAMDLTTDLLLANAAGKQLIADLMAEVVAAAKSAGVNLPTDTVEQQIERTYSMGAYKSSMQVDRQMGRPLEIEAIIERPLKAARAAGLSSPTWEMLLRQLRVLDKA